MAVFHDEVEIEDMEFDEDTEMYYYPCPCGDKFQISKVRKSVYKPLKTLLVNIVVFQKEDLENGEEVATCPSCSLLVRVIYDKVNF
jgi:hypothetical protein